MNKKLLAGVAAVLIIAAFAYVVPDTAWGWVVGVILAIFLIALVFVGSLIWVRESRARRGGHLTSVGGHAPRHVETHDDGHGGHGSGGKIFDWVVGSFIAVGAAWLIFGGGLLDIERWAINGGFSVATQPNGPVSPQAVNHVQVVYADPQVAAEQAEMQARHEIEATHISFTARPVKWETIPWIHFPDGYLLHLGPDPATSHILDIECVENVKEPPLNSGEPNVCPSKTSHWFRVRPGPASMKDDGTLADVETTYWFTWVDPTKVTS